MEAKGWDRIEYRTPRRSDPPPTDRGLPEAYVPHPASGYLLVRNDRSATSACPVITIMDGYGRKTESGATDFNIREVRPMKKKIVRVGLGILLLILIVLVVLFFSLDSIIKSQVQSRASAALGVPTSLQNASLNIFGGSLTLKGLKVANPPGYQGKYLLTMGTGIVTVDTGSLLSSTVQIPEIFLNNIHITLDESGLSSNLADVLANAHKYSASGSGTKGSAATQTSKSSSASGKRLAISRIVIPNCSVTLRLAAAKGTPGAGVTFQLHKIIINKPLDPNGRPLRLADLTSVILSQIAVQIAENSHLPQALSAALKGSSNLILNSLGKVIQGGAAVTKPIGKDIGNALNNIFHQGGSSK